ncbi:MAG: hypothetical protein ACPGJS_04185 [Flammeovirgaceae bacterium]
MTISINSVFKQNNANKTAGVDMPDNSEIDLKKMLEEALKENGETDTLSYKWVDDETVEVYNNRGLALHSFLLEVEKLGKDITFEKKTIIKITD